MAVGVPQGLTAAKDPNRYARLVSELAGFCRILKKSRSAGEMEILCATRLRPEFGDPEFVGTRLFPFMFATADPKLLKYQLALWNNLAKLNEYYKVISGL